MDPTAEWTGGTLVQRYKRLANTLMTQSAIRALLSTFIGHKGSYHVIFSFIYDLFSR